MLCRCRRKVREDALEVEHSKIIMKVRELFEKVIRKSYVEDDKLTKFEKSQEVSFQHAKISRRTAYIVDGRH